MAITNYFKNGVQLFRVYVQARGKEDVSLRLQRSKKNIATMKEARKEEIRLIKAVTEEIAKLEGRGLTWSEVIHRWEVKASIGDLGDKYKNSQLVSGHLSKLNKYTGAWFDRYASELTKGDGRQILNLAKNKGVSSGTLKQIKSSVNVVFKWAIEEKLVRGVFSSPVEGLCVSDKVEKIPKILTLEEVRSLLREAKLRNHDWYPIWAFAVLTGMRSGELMALKWSDIDLNKGIVTVSKSYKASKKVIKSTKAGYWRTVPISRDLEEVILELKNSEYYDPDGFVLPHFYAWRNGQAGAVLRQFLVSIGIDADVVFHTLRACFATHLLASGVDQAKVMKIGGWRDIKTFQIYVRLAGIDVKGATDALDVMPRLGTDNIVNMRQIKEA